MNRPDALAATSRVFRERASRLRRHAAATLVMIVGVLIAGIAIFIYAGDIASREANKALLSAKQDNLDFIAGRIRDVEIEAAQHRDAIRHYEREFQNEATGEGRSGATGMGIETQSLRQKLGRAQQRETELSNKLTDLEKQRIVAANELAEAQGSSFQRGSEEAQLYAMISAIVTRSGSVILLLFLVQILVPLYRYNTRLAAYYDARADAFSLIESHDLDMTEGLEHLVATLSPDTVSFGNPPPSPAEHAVELAKQLVSLRGTK